MDVVQVCFDQVRTAWTAIPLLLTIGAVIVLWFPGYNAKRCGHPMAWLVTAGGWALAAAGGMAALGGVIGTAIPFLLAGWVGLLVWSYGASHTNVRAVKAPRSAFSVILIDQPQAAEGAPDIIEMSTATGQA